MRLVVVTGATRGLGLSIVTHAAAAGYKVVAIARKPSSALTELMAGCPGQVVFEPYDFTDVDGIHAFVTMLTKRYGRPWGLVNNAAIGKEGILATLHEADVEEILRVNLHAPILMTKYVVRSMLLSKQGRIINVTSIIASTGFNGLSAYAASKGGLSSFSRSLAREVGQVGIAVNNVAPGYMDTEMTAGLSGGKLDSIRRRSPSGRLVTPPEVAQVVVYLLGDQAAGINGTTITVDGGSTA